ncbi:hypothetical protein [uncultured Litoreibacter sp.]|uniref:hypothetical protein n=1 Tax=uncultured Litoreibacter sp. TaxID=1392394 RepID=UPI0026067119|nr:hypothetical protein [uncultured Litoreibacter sp.]
MRVLGWSLALLSVAACTPPAIAVKTVREAVPSEVVSCTELGRVTGVPGVYGPLAKVGLNDARNVAKRTALEQGANTVVFDEIPAGETVYQVEGTAYIC